MSTPAKAQPAPAGPLVFDFAYEILGTSAHPISVTASGQLTATPTATLGQYVVVGITGTRNGEVITGLLAPGGFYDNDNLLFVGVPHLSASGLAFRVAAGGDDPGGDVLVYHSALGYTEPLGTVGYTDTFTLTSRTPGLLTAAPEPATWALLGAGLLAVGGVARRRRRV